MNVENVLIYRRKDQLWPGFGIPFNPAGFGNNPAAGHGRGAGVPVEENETAPAYRERIRGFWHGGYYLGEKVGEWAASAENRATLVKTFAGKVTHYYPKMEIAAIRLTARSVRAGERFLITGPTTGVVEGVIDSLRVDDSAVDAAEKGAEITFPVPETVRENDKCYILSERSGNETERSLNLPPSEEHRA